MKKISKKGPNFVSFDQKAQLAFVAGFQNKRKIQKKKDKKKKVSSITDAKRKRMSDLRTIARQIESEQEAFNA